ncbi:MAG: pseudouridine synthase [Gammaproteobacteria bacterium]
MARGAVRRKSGATPGGRRAGLARALSKLGACSRSMAEALIRAGRVRVDGRVVRDPLHWVAVDEARVEIDGALVRGQAPVHLMLNKPRGLVTTAADERGRETVYRCLRDADLPWVGPVGRLDKASEGLLLFTNDTRWAAAVLDPARHVRRRYHVQIDRPPDPALAAQLQAGVAVDGEVLGVAAARVLRAGARTGWLEIELDEGRNRQIRRSIEALGIGVLRLVRIGIGDLVLGDLQKGAWRMLTREEVASLVPQVDAGARLA